jgi:hypothetical protein
MLALWLRGAGVRNAEVGSSSLLPSTNIFRVFSFPLFRAAQLLPIHRRADVLLLTDGDPMFSCRCADRAELNFVVNALRQDATRAALK